MTGWLAAGRGAAYFVLVLLGISLVTFVLGSLMPGDPAEILIREQIDNPSAEQLAGLRRELGLDRPFVHRYAAWLLRTFPGTWGVPGAPVSR